MKRDFITGRLVDDLGKLKAEAKAIDEQADFIKAELITLAANGAERAFEGDLFRAAVVFGARSSLDKDALFAELGEFHVHPDILQRLIRKHTKVAPDVPSVRVFAKGE